MNTIKYISIAFILAVFLAMLTQSPANAEKSDRTDNHYHRFKFSDESLPIQQRAEHAKALIEKETEETYEVTMEAASMCLEAGRYDLAVSLISPLLDGEIKKLPVDKKCKALTLAADILMRDGDYIRSNEIAEEVLHMSKPDSLLLYDLKIYELLSYINLLNPSVTGTYLKYSEEIFEKAKRRHLNKNTLEEMEMVILSQRMRDSWYKDSLGQVMDYARQFNKLNIPPRYRIITDNMRGLVSMRLGDSIEAKRYFTEILESGKFSYNHATVLRNLTSLLNRLHLYGESLDSYNKYMHDSYKYPTLLYAGILEEKGVALGGLGKYEEAYKTLREAMALSDSIISATSINKSMHYLEIDRKEKEIEAIDQKLATSHIITWIMVAVAFVAIIAAGVFIMRLKRKNHHLQLVNSMHEVKAREDADTVRAKDEELEKMARELVGRTMRIEQYENAIDEISTTVGLHKFTPSEKITTLKAIIRDLDRSAPSWELFSNHFEKTDQHFVKEIKRLHPDLTPNEMRLISYIIMNLTTKEIAEMTNKSIRSIDSARYRLGKKLNLPDGDSLSSYLHDLAKSQK